MNIAVISFDQDFINQVKRELPNEQIKGYIDSLSMLKELSEFNPDVIIYDASSGEFAIDDLKFLLTREKVEKKRFRILLSREQPVDIDSFPEVEDIIYYTKETDIPKLISDIRSDIGAGSKTVQESVMEDQHQVSSEDFESFMEPTTFEESLPEPESNVFENLGEFSLSEEEEKEIKESLELLEEHKPEASKDHTSDSFFFGNEIHELTPETEKTKSEEERPFESYNQETSFLEKSHTDVVSSSENIKIELDISVEDIKKVIAEKAVQQLVKDVLKSPEMEELVNNIQRDFVERMEEELDKIKEEIKSELKEKISASLEEELKESLLNTIKEDVAKLTSQIVKERLEQLFGGR